MRISQVFQGGVQQRLPFHRGQGGDVHPLSRGVPVVDGDRLSRELTAAGSPVLEDLRQAFGPEIFYDDGSLNRRRLGRIVFSDPRAREQLDDLMAPHLFSLTRQRIDEIRVSCGWKPPALRRKSA